MIITGLVGALVASSYKWGYFVFAMFALFFIAYNVCYVGFFHSKHFSQQVHNTYRICGVWTIFLWFMYPIAWGICEGGNVISPDSEAIFYGVLDILAKPVFGTLLLWGHRTIDPAELGLHIREYGDDTNGVGQGREKYGLHSGVAGTTNGTSHVPVETGTTGVGDGSVIIPSTNTNAASAIDSPAIHSHANRSAV